MATILEEERGILDQVNKPVFYSVVALLALSAAYILIDGKGAQAFFTNLYSQLLMKFSWGFLLGVAAVLISAIYIGFSRFGNLKLGLEEDQPEFSFLAWGAMMFSAGVGLSALMWAVAEPIYHLHTSTRVVEGGMAGKPAGIPLSMAQTWFDSGIHGWALFTVGGLAIAFPAYRLKKPMTLGIGLYGILGERSFTGPWGKITDILGVVSTVGGNGASLGIGILAIAYGFNHIFGIELGLTGQLFAMGIIVVLFILSAVSGLHNGIRILSLTNIYLMIGMCIFLFLTGATNFVASTVTQTIGTYIAELPSWTFWTDAGNFEDGAWKQRSWLNWWVIFFWLWWVTYIPFVGGFLARISRGRTIRQYIFGSMLFPMGMIVMMGLGFGANALYLDATGAAPLWDSIQKDFGSALFVFLDQFPLAGLLAPVAFVSLIVFGVTTSDSAAFFLAMVTSNGNLNPSVVLRIFWGVVLGAVALVFLATGGLEALKGLAIVAGAPFFFVVLGYVVSVFKMLKMADEGEF